MFSAKPVTYRQESPPQYCGVTTLNPCRCCKCPNWERHGCHCPPNNTVSQEDVEQFLAFERRRMARRALDPEWQAIDPIENGHPCIDTGCLSRSRSQGSSRHGHKSSPLDTRNANGEVLNCCGEVFDPEHPCCEGCARALGASTAEPQARRRYLLPKLDYPYKTISTAPNPQYPCKIAKPNPYNVKLNVPSCDIYNSAQEARKAYVFKKLPKEESYGTFVCMDGSPLVYCTNKYVPSLSNHVQCVPPQFQSNLQSSGSYMCYTDPTIEEGRHINNPNPTPEIRSAIAFHNRVKRLQSENDRQRTVLHDLEARLREGGECFERTRIPSKSRTLRVLLDPNEKLRPDSRGSNRLYREQEAARQRVNAVKKFPAGVGLGDGTHDCRTYCCARK